MEKNVLKHFLLAKRIKGVAEHINCYCENGKKAVPLQRI